MPDDEAQRWQAADELNERGRVHLDAGDLDRALPSFEQAVAICPEMATAWFNIGLIHKLERRWTDSVRANLQVIKLAGERNHPAWWNLGIASTALGRWDLARRCWEDGLGATLPDGEGPIEADFGIGAVRLEPTGEVVWGRRIDPVRLRILNVPLPESGHRWSDVVLHDAEPRGRRRWEGHDYAVFDEIDRSEPAEVPIIEAEVSCRSAADSEALRQLFVDAGHGAEDWTESVHLMCRECSEGDPGHVHEHVAPPWQADRRIGLAAPLDVAEGLLATWVQQTAGSVSSVTVLVS